MSFRMSRIGMSRIATNWSTMNRVTSSGLAVVALAMSLLAVPQLGWADDAPVPATQPDTRQAMPERIDALIQQLGDADFKTRESATAELTKIGKPALDALKKATVNSDQEIASRAKIIVANMDAKEHPAQEPKMNDLQEVRIQQHMQVVPGIGMGKVNMESVSTQNHNGIIDTTVMHNGNKAIMHKDEKGIKISLTANGKTTDWEADSVEDLKTKSAEGYQVYEDYFGGTDGSGQMIHGGSVIQIHPGLRRANIPEKAPTTEEMEGK